MSSQRDIKTETIRRDLPQAHPARDGFSVTNRQRMWIAVGAAWLFVAALWWAFCKAIS